jgi:[acyl-carrier-protein] S-malonyltransferase
MKEAAEAFAPILEKVNFSDPAIPVFSNVTGKQITSGAEAKALALRQIVEAVRWTNEEGAIGALGGIECLLETGPGKVLQGLWKDAGSALPCFAAGTAAEINELLNK